MVNKSNKNRTPKITYIQQRDEFNHLKSMIETAKRGKTLGILLIGPPGTGKTLLGTDLALSFGASCHVIDGSPDLDRRDLEGVWEIQEKMTEFNYGQLVQGVQDANKDGISFIIINEINAIRENEQISLNGLLSENAIDLISRAGERWELKPESKLIIIGTMNPGITGVVRLQDAFDDRFRMNKVIDYPEKGKEVEIVSKISGCGAEIADLVVDTGRQLRKAAVQDMTIDKIFSTRKMVNFCETISLMPPQFIRSNIEDMIINKLAESPESKKSIGLILSGKMFESKLKSAVVTFQNANKKTVVGEAAEVDHTAKTDEYIVKSMKNAMDEFISKTPELLRVNKTGYMRWTPIQWLWNNKRKVCEAYFKLTERTDLPNKYKKQTGNEHIYGGNLTLRYIKWLYRDAAKDLLNFMTKVRPVISIKNTL